MIMILLNFMANFNESVWQKPDTVSRLDAKIDRLETAGLVDADNLATSESVNKNQLNELAENKSKEDGKNEAEDNDEEDDECIKSARANIKACRDRMKETDLFLKSLAASDEEAQRQRQELFTFNEMMIRNKLNGLTSKLDGLFDNGNDENKFNNGINPSNKSSMGYMSAPIKSSSLMTSPFAQMMSMANYQKTSMFSANNGDNDDTMMKQENHPCDLYATTRRRPSIGCYDSMRTTRQDYDTPHLGSRKWQCINYPYDNPITGSNSNGTQFTRAQSLAPEVLESRQPESSAFSRSTFQTFAPDWMPQSIQPRSMVTKGRRPLSIDLTMAEPIHQLGNSNDIENEYTTSQRIMRPSYDYSRRASSVARHSLNYDSNPIVTKAKQPTSASVYMTEYQRAYGSTITKTNITDNGIEKNGFFSARDSLANDEELVKNVPLKSAENHQDEDELIEQSMDAYRPSSYVPKIVPQGMPARSRDRHSRSYQRRSLTSAELQRNISPSITSSNADKQRHTSISDNKTYSKLRNSPSPSPARTRRYSYFGPSEQKDLNETTTTASAFSSRRFSMGNNLQSNSDDFKENATENKAISAFASTSTATSASDRLSELELRMEANKKRREELLATSKREFASFAGKTVLNTPKRDQGRLTNSTQRLADYSPSRSSLFDENRPRARSVARELSPNPMTNDNIPDSDSRSQRTPPARLVPRSSRLESMEARIKRRSYYVRVADQNNDEPNSRQNNTFTTDTTRQESLDRWQSRRASSIADND